MEGRFCVAAARRGRGSVVSLVVIPEGCNPESVVCCFCRHHELVSGSSRYKSGEDPRTLRAAPCGPPSLGDEIFLSHPELVSGSSLAISHPVEFLYGIYFIFRPQCSTVGDKCYTVLEEITEGTVYCIDILPKECSREITVKCESLTL